MTLDLANPLWRLQNLYFCKEEGTGRVSPFRPRPEQEIVLRGLYDLPNEPDIIIKSRRLGMSTGIGAGMMDFCAWNGGATGRLIERTQDFAADKMRNIIRFAFDSQIPEIRARFDVRRKDSQSVLDPKLAGADEKYRSEIHAGVAARGGDCSILWVSEMGPIAFRDPKRAEEIITGAFPAARKGKIIVETTWMGGKSGHLWEQIKPLLERDPDARGRILFFPWHGDPQCMMMDGKPVSAETEEYFRSLAETAGRHFNQEQKRWYAVTAKQQGIFMKREYPSTLAEAFSAPVEGAIYAKEVSIVFARGDVVTGLPVDGTQLVNTAWDLGAPKNTRVWYFQVVGYKIRILRIDMGTEENITERWARMLTYGYKYGKHYLPHDAAQTERNGASMETSCKNAGMTNTVVVPKTNVHEGAWFGINALKGLFPYFVFDAKNCAEALDDMQAYHTHPESNEPVHDASSHTADGGRTMAEAYAGGLFKFSFGDTSYLPEDHPMRERHGRRRGMKPIKLGG